MKFCTDCSTSAALYCDKCDLYFCKKHEPDYHKPTFQAHHTPVNIDPKCDMCRGDNPVLHCDDCEISEKKFGVNYCQGCFDRKHKPKSEAAAHHYKRSFKRKLSGDQKISKKVKNNNELPTPVNTPSISKSLPSVPEDQADIEKKWKEIKKTAGLSGTDVEVLNRAQVKQNALKGAHWMAQMPVLNDKISEEYLPIVKATINTLNSTAVRNDARALFYFITKMIVTEIAKANPQCGKKSATREIAFTKPDGGVYLTVPVGTWYKDFATLVSDVFGVAGKYEDRSGVKFNGARDRVNIAAFVYQWFVNHVNYMSANAVESHSLYTDMEEQFRIVVNSKRHSDFDKYIAEGRKVTSQNKGKDGDESDTGSLC